MNQINNNASVYTIGNNTDNQVNEPEDYVSDNDMYRLHVQINQSINLATTYLEQEHNRPVGLVNNTIEVSNNQTVDLFDYFVINNNLIEGNYALIAYSGYNDLWYVRKTSDGIVQYFNLMTDNDDGYIFSLFIKGYDYAEVYI